MCRTKKVMVIVMAIVLLVGGAITVHASGLVQKEPEYPHSFKAAYSLLRSEYLGMHPYLTGWDTTGGTPIPLYVTCYVEKNYYTGESGYADAVINGILDRKTETIHSTCGLRETD